MELEGSRQRRRRPIFVPLVYHRTVACQRGTVRLPTPKRGSDASGAANKIDTEDPEPLYEFYRSYTLQGIRPTTDAIRAMHYASDLAPEDFGLRMNSALAYLNEGKSEDARSALAVVAYSPHAANLAEIARNMIARIDAGDAKGALAAAQVGSSKNAN
jgi:hypothetical protein